MGLCTRLIAKGLCCVLIEAKCAMAKMCFVHVLGVMGKNHAVMAPPVLIPSVMAPPVMIPSVMALFVIIPSVMAPPVMIPSVMASPMMILCDGFICFHVITVPKFPEQSMQIPSPSFSAAKLCLKQVDKDME